MFRVVNSKFYELLKFMVSLTLNSPEANNPLPYTFIKLLLVRGHINGGIRTCSCLRLKRYRVVPRPLISLLFQPHFSRAQPLLLFEALYREEGGGGQV